MTQFFKSGWAACSMAMGLVLPGLGLAQSLGSAQNAVGHPLGASNVDGGPLRVTPFRYIPSPNASIADPDAPKRTPEQQSIVDLNLAGNYAAVGSEGRALMAKEKADDELVLIIANSLAWTGKLKDAIHAYQGLAGGKFAKEGNVGLANAQRWLGRDDLAMPLYQAVLAVDPENVDALAGQMQASREMSPRTRLSFGGNRDLYDSQRRSATLNHRWRDKSGAKIMEIETSRVNDTLPNVQASQQDVTVRYEDLSLSLKPSVELSVTATGDKTLFGRAGIKFYDDQATLTVARVNWGRMVINPNALAANLTAYQVGVGVVQSYALGNLRGRLDFYNISDGNQIWNGRLHLNTAWRPFGNHFVPFVGVEARSAKFNATNYSSPQAGSGSLYGGLTAEWGEADWNYYAAGQVGARLYGEAGRGWSASTGAKRWLTNDVALAFDLSSLASQRDNVAYRAQSAVISVEKLWR